MEVKQIKKHIDIKDIVSKYIYLSRIGKDRYRGYCPFHNEKRPSFTVYSDTQSYYCFGCGAGSDVISFLMKINRIDFKTALKHLS